MSGMKTHLLGGIVSYFILLSVLRHSQIFLPPKLAVLSLFFCITGALIPDVDFKRSKVHRAIFFTFTLTLLAIALSSKEVNVFYGALILLVVTILLRKKIKHRKFFHSIIFGVIFSFFAGIISLAIANEFIIPAIFSFTGFFSHLILDKKI
jgi:membrane-bound metal-dependent hydrolase YbcI (DUF457 family)